MRSFIIRFMFLNLPSLFLCAWKRSREQKQSNEFGKKRGNIFKEGAVECWICARNLYMGFSFSSVYLMNSLSSLVFTKFTVKYYGSGCSQVLKNNLQGLVQQVRRYSSSLNFLGLKLRASIQENLLSLYEHTISM